MNAIPPLLTLNDATLAFGTPALLQNITLALFPKDRVCFVGRNGCGKSTLMKVLTGALELDRGERYVKPGLSIGVLDQALAPSIPLSAFDFLKNNAAQDVEDYVIEETLSHLTIDPQKLLSTLSGGESRRVMLAKALMGRPDVLLLDEPTNHLDLVTIEWLEERLMAYPGAILMVSHDRTFLTKLSARTFWLDRGRLRILDKGYPFFEEWSEGIIDHEVRTQEKLSQKISEETHWLHRGVTGRRRRNMGRLRNLLSLRQDARQHQGSKGGVELASNETPMGSKLVAEAKGICKKRGDKTVLQNFSCRVARGDRIGIIGPNGAGKTTLIKLLTGELEPDSGHIRLAKNLEIAIFDQTHAALDLSLTPWDILCEHGGDQVFVQGEPRHVMGYLQDFLFDRKQALTPLKSLSGGERHRLLLAKILAKPSNVLILDEPTNDLDMDTLDLLQEYLAAYEGTLLLISHDRDFLDRTTTHLWAFEGEGRVQPYVGGYSDYVAQRAPVAPVRIEKKKTAVIERVRTQTKLSYNDMRELSLLPDEMEKLSRDIQRYEEQMADPGFFTRDPKGFDGTMKQLQTAQHSLQTKEERWLMLIMKEEALAGEK